ncbi:hypothetical protein BCU68_04130 [Vibrio sp. 10N.286.49.B3]|uniref:hypothetical protein n=1 Tax=Vibrio sp. 10N.286.49.B3 TaxID=1880855 RepID=UPI000C84DD68|nr:hypothetical protein [Vibrio sp. 10N.286.49.B3]PMH43184.1 hypothetical protein BCU68_04130 [Vibrio sp. 10N.286.49.B3]
MNYKPYLISIAIGVSSSASAGCDFLQRSIMFFDNEELSWCHNLADSLDSVSYQVITLGGLLGEEPQDHYWENWALQPEDAPLFSQHISDNHFGVGVWMPEELLEIESQMTTEEWLRNHGLQLSVGFGNKKYGEPRFRVDYRWHDSHDGDLMMQIEVPF